MIKKILICLGLLLCYSHTLAVSTETLYTNITGSNYNPIGLNFGENGFFVTKRIDGANYYMSLYSATGVLIKNINDNIVTTDRKLLYKNNNFALISEVNNTRVYYVDSNNIKIIDDLATSSSCLIYKGELYYKRFGDNTNIYKNTGGTGSVDTTFTFSFATNNFFNCYNNGQSQFLYNSYDLTTNQNIYFDDTVDKYYLQTIIQEGGSFLTSKKEIFIGSIIGSELESLSLSSTYKTDINYSRFYTFDSENQRYYYLSNCFNVNKTITISGSGYTTRNITFIGTRPFTSNLSSGFVGLDDKYYKGVLGGIWLKQLNYSVYNFYGSECNKSIIYTNFNNGIPQRIGYIKGNGIYTLLLDDNDKNLLTGNTPTGGTGSSYDNFSGSGAYNETEIIEDIWNLDRDGDGSVSTIESVLAPITIGQNIINKLYQSLKDLWTFFKAILEIGNISFIPTSYASHDATQIITKIGSGTSQIFNGENEDLTTISDLIVYIKYGFFFALFMIILAILFTPLIFKKS